MFYFNTRTDIPHNVIPELELGDSVTITHAHKLGFESWSIFSRTKC